MSNQLIFAGGLAVLVLIMALLWVKACKEGEIGINLGNSTSPNDLLNITIRRESFPTLYWIVLSLMAIFILGLAVGVVLVARGAA